MTGTMTTLSLSLKQRGFRGSANLSDLPDPVAQAPPDIHPDLPNRTAYRRSDSAGVWHALWLAPAACGLCVLPAFRQGPRNVSAPDRCVPAASWGSVQCRAPGRGSAVEHRQDCFVGPT